MPVLNAMELRGLAEWASGYRGEIIDFYEEDGKIRLWERRKGPCPCTPFLTCNTPSVVAQRPAVTEATMRAGTDTVDLLRIPYRGTTVAADAVFWSESAVEKFLFPYYAAKGEWQADLYTEALRTVFYGPRALAEYQRVQQDPGAWEDPGSEQDPSRGAMIDEAFGLVHIPKSDYIPQGDTVDDAARTAPMLPSGGDLGVLTRHRETGAVRMQLLSERVGAPRAAEPPASAASFMEE